MPPAPHLCYQELTVFFNQTRHLGIGFLVLIPGAYAARPVAKKIGASYLRRTSVM
jgi:hypothetical protein